MNRLIGALFLIPTLASCQPEDDGSPKIEILRVYEKPIEGSEAITVERLHLEGFVSPPDSIHFDTVAKVDYAEEERSRGGMVNEDGSITPDTVTTVYLITIHLDESSREDFTAFTKKAQGHRVLMRIGETPLLAPMVHFPIDVPSFQITLSDREEAVDLNAKLQTLVRESKNADQAGDGDGE